MMTVDEFKKILANGHLYRSIYHFSDRTNLPSIKKYGIVSKQYAVENGIKVSVYGGNDWSHDADAQKGLEDYVNLCFTSNHPMCHSAHEEGRIQSPIYISIDPDVLKIPGTLIALDVANKSGVELHDIETGLSMLDLEVLYKWTEWKDADVHERLSNAEKCETLVPRYVPMNLLKRVF